MIQKLYLHLNRFVEPVCQAGCLNVLVIIPAWRLEYHPQGTCLHLLPLPRLLYKWLMQRFKGITIYIPSHTVLFHNWEYCVTQRRVTELGKSRMRKVKTRHRQLGMVQMWSRLRAGNEETVCQKAAKMAGSYRGKVCFTQSAWGTSQAAKEMWRRG